MKQYNIPSSKLYIIILILAVGILLFIASLGYKQTKLLEQQSTQISHTLEVQKEISTLYSSLSLMVSTALANNYESGALNATEWEFYEKESEKARKNLLELSNDRLIRQENIIKLTGLQNELLSQLEKINQSAKAEAQGLAGSPPDLFQLTWSLRKIRELKDEMLMQEELLLMRHKESYTSSITLTPLASLASVIFSLLIFIFAFQKLNQNRKRIANTQAFLENILKSTDNVIVYYDPLKDSNGQILDFIIRYSNDAITGATGNQPEDLKGRKMSEVFPMLIENGIFDNLVKCIETNIPQHIEKEYHQFKDHVQIFQSTAIRLGEGALLTSTDKTVEILSERKLKRLNDRLSIQNAILNDAEALAKIGSYRWDLTTLQSTISDNYYRILDCEPGEMEFNYESYREVVHPNDLDIYDEVVEQIRNKKEFLASNYRIITKKGTVKYLKTIGHFENDLVVGLVQDVSEDFKSEQKLRKKNEDLIRSNKELESFNRVASHDLQEPLRKIQMFISRLSDAELGKLSEKSRGYFQKVSTSANRMQTLIKYLLSYSRINRTKDEFVKIDLDDVLEKVKDDLEDRIKEADVHIAIDNMPTLKAVPFQMEQLFNNLISNAIKYRRVDEESKIIIDCKKVSSEQIGGDFRTKAKQYYRISVMDNGIGFDQSNATKIFELFQRLHQKHEYFGTGIGLAICKKIVENHNGHIVAEGVLGDGSTFCVYLPS